MTPSGIKTPKPSLWTDGIGKIPPSDIESEKALIGALIYSPRKLFDVRALLDEGEVFYKADHADYYQAILTISDQGQQVRPLTLMQLFRKTGKEELPRNLSPDELMNLGVGVDVVTTALYLREMYIQRLALTKAGELISSVFAHEPLDVQVSLTQGLADTLSGKMSIAITKPLSHYVALTLKGIHEAIDTPTGLTGVNTGLGKINKITGGWRPKKFIILGGRPGSGKTAVALYHAKAAAIDGNHVAFISAEMPVEEMILRLISSECGISYEDLGKGRYDNGNAFSEDDIQRIHKAGGYIEKLPLHFYDGADYDIANIMYWVLDMIRRYEVKLAIGDYVQIFTDRSVKGGNLREVVASVSRKLKLLTTNANLPVIALSQISREVDERPNKRPTLRDFKESGQLEQDADIAIGLYRDDYYKLEEAKKNPGPNGKIIPPAFDNKIEYDILKYRGGKLKRATLWIDIGTNRLADEEPMVPVAPQPTLDAGYFSKYPAEAARSFGEAVDPKEETPF